MTDYSKFNITMRGILNSNYGLDYYNEFKDFSIRKLKFMKFKSDILALFDPTLLLYILAFVLLFININIFDKLYTTRIKKQEDKRDAITLLLKEKI